MSRCLFLDSSLQGVAVGVATLGRDASGFQAVCTHQDNSGSAAVLPDLVGRLLDECQLTARELDGVVVSVGPGTFTGIRVGLSFAGGLTVCKGVSRKVLGLSSAACACRHGWRDHEGGTAEKTRALVIPSTRTVGYFTWEDGHQEAVDLEAAHEAQEAERVWARLARADATRLVGEWPLFESLASKRQVSFIRVDKEQMRDHALRGMLCEARALGWEAFSSSVPLPLYLRMSTPEEKLRAGGHR